MASPDHRILTPRGYLRFDEVRVGDQLFSLPTLCPEAVCQIEVLVGSFQVVNLVVEQFASFFAEGLLVEDQVGAELLEVAASQSGRNDDAIQADHQPSSLLQAPGRGPSLPMPAGSMGV